MDGWIENPIRSWVGGWCTAVRGRGSRTPIGRPGRGFRTGDITRGPIRGRYHPRGPRAAVTMRSRRARGRIGRARPVGMLTGSPTRRLNFPRAGSSRPHLGGLLRDDDALADEGGGGEHGGHLVRGTVSVTGRCDWRECVYGEARGRPRSNDIIRGFLGFIQSDVTKRSTGSLKNLCFAKWTTRVAYI
jgi:hypothetical protein